MSDLDPTLRGAQSKIRGLLGGQGVDHTAHEKDERIAEEVQQQHKRKSHRLVDESTAQIKEETETEETEVKAEDVTDDSHDESQDDVDVTENDDDHIQSIIELAESLEVEPETLYAIRVPITDGKGQKSEIALGELKDKFQLYSKATEEQTRFEQERQTFETQRQQAEQVLIQRLTEADSFLSEFENQFSNEEKSINWKQLRETNPSEYSALKADFADRKEQLTRQRQAVAERFEEQQKEQMQSMYQSMVQRREQETKALLQAVPEWSNETVAKTEKDKLKKYLIGSGFTEQDVASAMDHRLVVMARKAMLFDQGAKKADVAKKKVKTLPKRVKPGSTTTDNTAVTKEKEIRGRLRKSGSIHDAAALLRSRNL